MSHQQIAHLSTIALWWLRYAARCHAAGYLMLGPAMDTNQSAVDELVAAGLLEAQPDGSPHTQYSVTLSGLAVCESIGTLAFVEVQ